MRNTFVEFKPGKAGARLPAGFFGADRARLLDSIRILALEAPATVDGVVVITEVWREGTGYHPKLWAYDVRTGVLSSDLRGAILAPTKEERQELARRWFSRVHARAGREFDIIFGTDPNHIDHAHIELDQKKRAAHRR